MKSAAGFVHTNDRNQTRTLRNHRTAGAVLAPVDITCANRRRGFSAVQKPRSNLEALNSTSVCAVPRLNVLCLHPSTALPEPGRTLPYLRHGAFIVYALTNVCLDVQVSCSRQRLGHSGSELATRCTQGIPDQRAPAGAPGQSTACVRFKNHTGN